MKLKEKDNLYYVATMMPFGEETLKKIERHKLMRKDKGFKTIECFYELEKIEIEKDSLVLLECMSNLVANEMFSLKKDRQRVVDDVLRGVERLKDITSNLIIISNEVFSDGLEYDKESIEYIKCLGEINRKIAKMADQVIEVVYGIAVFNKGEDKNDF